ncbi:MAG: M14 family zinc carboxypeptidase [Bacteroidota bacterium]
MKKLLILVMIIFTTVFGFANDEKYSKVKIYTDGTGLKKLAALGLAVDEGIYRKDQYFISDFSKKELDIIRSNGFNVDILADDVVAEYLKKNEEFVNKPMAGDPKLSLEYPVPDEFQLGSMGGFCTLEQFVGHLDNMFAHYPDLITPKTSIGLSIENRPIYMVKLSGASSQKGPKPQVLYTGMHHAREPIGMMHLLFYIYYLLENYSTNPEIKYLVDNTEMFFIPIMNPDGYKYNQTSNPSGGGMWRKNRHNNGDGSYGVDLNRNYGYMWGGEGSSGYPADEIYRGTTPFSEAENQAVKNFCESNNIRIALNYHCVSSLLLFPWGYTDTELPTDYALFRDQAELMTADNHYAFGPGATTIYVTSGGSDDWMYGEQTTKKKILSYTPEVGGNGFWPAMNEIIPLCQENMLQSLLAAKFVSNWGSLKDRTPAIISQTTGYLKFSLSQLGLDSNRSFSISITPLGNEFTTIGDPVIVGGIIPGETVIDSIPYILNQSIQSGATLSYILKLNDGFMVREDTVTKIFGPQNFIFNDLCSNLDNWTSTGWGVTTSTFHSAPACITDSPNGNYKDNTNKSITLANTVDLTATTCAELNFWAKWDIEEGYDYVQVKISTDGGSTWTALAGNYTHPATSWQVQGEPVYTGTQSSWVMENIDLTPYSGNTIKLGFTLVSDDKVTGDGFYFDDVSVITIGAPAGHMISGLISYPNAFATPLSEVQVNLKNNIGSIIATSSSNQNGNYSFNGIGNGSYSIEAGTNKSWGGVTALDLLLFQKHIVNIAPLYGIFLASGDVNGDGSLTAGDILLIRKRIASIINSFPSGDWLFNPLPVIVNGNNVVNSFNGLTYGDANGSYKPVSDKNTNPLVTEEGSLTIGSFEATSGQLEVPVYADDMTNLGSFQFTIRFDPETLVFKDITSVYPGLESVLVGCPEPGILTFVWAADENGLNITHEKLFSLRFISGSNNPSGLNFSDAPTSAEFSYFDGNLFSPLLNSGKIGNTRKIVEMAGDEFSVFPNPGHGVFGIISNRNKDAVINVKVTDQMGKVVYVQKGIIINANINHPVNLSFLRGGIYILFIEYNKQSFIKKIIIL